VIDVPRLDEFNDPFGQIAKALNLPAGELPSRLIEINALKHKSVIVGCRAHKCAAKAAVLLRDPTSMTSA
jgi:rhodanese-related sulfurtransferase